jgi:hypothetical protein
LGFRIYAVVEHINSTLLLLCFTAADTLYSLLLIPRYFAARLTIASVSRRFPIIKAVQAAMKAIFLSRCFSLLKPSLQQRVERNCIFPVRQYQQDFLITRDRPLLCSPNCAVS